jgi:thiosulfate/3-mercaptopyruvate sulfurtransferase
MKSAPVITMNIQRFAFLSLAISSALFAQKAPLLVDTNWLSSHLNDRDLVLLHVGPKSDYVTGHIPGARFITLEDVAVPMNHTDPKEIMLELPTPEVLRAKLETFGISNDSRIVVYFGAKGALQSSTRVVFTLDYLGLGDHTSILNGGMPAWTTAGKPLTAAAPTITPGKLTPRPTKDVVATVDVVKAVSQHAGQKLIDARAPVYYNGTEATYEKNGHIPGAANIPFSELLDTTLMLDHDRLEKLFTAAGVKPGDTVVAYCHIGQQATAVVFAARLLGHPVMLYDGSFQDWAINSRGPVEK